MDKNLRDLERDPGDGIRLHVERVRRGEELLPIKWRMSWFAAWRFPLGAPPFLELMKAFDYRKEALALVCRPLQPPINVRRGVIDLKTTSVEVIYMGSAHGTEAAEMHGIRRSSHWPTVEKHFLASNPRCIACSPGQKYDRENQNPRLKTRGLQVHHALMPFHFVILLGRPDLELDPRNLVVLCEDEAGVKTEDHHNIVGHFRNFQSYAPDAAGVARTYNGWSKQRLLADAGFLALCSALPPVWGKLTDAQKRDLRAMLDQKLPVL